MAKPHRVRLGECVSTRRSNLIEVEIRYDEDQLRVRIRDHGKEIDRKILEAGGQPRHWGIPGMSERAQRIGLTDFLE